VLLRRLAVFAGGFTVDAVEAICTGGELEGPSLLDLPISLVEKSLVQVGDDSTDGRRYRLLETLKQYGLERLDEAGERVAPRRPGLAIG
jgi:predicted ATPase